MFHRIELPKESSINSHDMVVDSWKAVKDDGIVSWNNEFGIADNLFHSVLGTKIGIGVKGGRNSNALIQVLVQIDVVTGKDRRTAFAVDTDILRLIGVFATDIARNSRRDFLIVALHQSHAAFGVEPDQSQ